MLPLVSIILLTYNQEQYVKDALQSILDQDYNNLEIIISDDCSLDATPNIIRTFIQEHFSGRNVLFNRNEQNIGLIGNCNKAIELSHGEYIVLAAGDDISLSNRVSISVEKITKLGVDGLAMNFQYINAEGRKLNQYGINRDIETMLYTINDYINHDPVTALGPSKIISRRVFEVFGLLSDNCQTEDTTLTFRALLLNGIAKINTIGLLYRWHGNNLSAQESLMMRINPILIYKQYKRDLRLAYDKKLISSQQYHRIFRILLDYKHVQTFIRKRYMTDSVIKKHFIGIIFLLNPFVLSNHKSRNWLIREFPEVFLIKDKIKCTLNR